MIAIKVKSCTWHGAWYDQHIGHVVPYLGKVSATLVCYVSREQSGFVNYVQVTDSELVEVPDDTEMYSIHQDKEHHQQDSISRAVTWAKKGIDDANVKWNNMMKGNTK